MLVKIDQREGCQQPFMIFLDAAIAHFGVLEDALQDAKWPFDFGAYSRLGAVLALGFLIDFALAVVDTSVGHILCLWSSCADHLGLPLIPRIAPDLSLTPMEQVGQHVFVVN